MYLVLTVIILCFLYYYCTRTFNYWNKRNVKGPKPIPFFGNFKDVAFRRKHMGMLYRDLYKQYPEEKVVGLYRMTSPTLLIRDLDIVKQIMIKDFESFPDRATYFSKKGFGDNIFHSDVDTWRFLRQQFSSVFTTTKFKGIFSQLVDCSDKFVDYIEDSTMKKPEVNDVYRLMLKYTVGSTMISIFGMTVDTFNDTNRLFEIVDEKLTNSYYNEMDMLLPGFLTKFNLSLLREEVISFCHQIVAAGINQNLIPKSSQSNVMDVIMNMRKAGDINNTNSDKNTFLNITEDLLAAQAWMFYTAGYANNTLAMTYAMYHLARNPDVQDKLREEITEVMSKYDGKLTYEALKQMKYLDMIFEETMRIHPLTNGLIRGVSKDVKLDGTDITINQGTVVVVSAYSIQHDEKYFPEPEKFWPERFLPENISDRHPCAFLSFGVGRRSCLGTQLARIQFGIGLVKVLSKFYVEPTKNTVSSINYEPRRLLLTPDQKKYLNFIPREL